MSETKVKFYRGKTWNPATEGEPTNNGEVVMINDAMYDQVGTKEGQISQEEYNARKKFGSVYQDDKIVGTTRAEQLMTTADITIQGGPLANDIAESGETWPFGTDDAGNKIIPAGTSIQSILTNLFLKEKWGAPGTPVEATLTTAVDAPTPSLSATTKTGSLVEIGDTITVAKITANAVTYGGTTTTSVSGFTYGYSATDDNIRDSSNKSVFVNRGTPTANSNEKYSMTITNNFGATVPTITSSATPSEVTCKSSTNTNIAFTGTAIKGLNTVNVSETGVGSKATVPPLQSYFACSNVGNTHKSDGSTITSKSVESKTLSVNAPTNSDSASLTGVYRLYTNGKQTTETYIEGPFEFSESEYGFGLVDYSSSKTLYACFGSPSEKTWEVYLPKSEGLKLSGAYAYNSVSTKYETASNNITLSSTSKTIKCLAGDIEYDVYQIDGVAGNNIKLTITKK